MSAQNRLSAILVAVSTAAASVTAVAQQGYSELRAYPSDNVCDVVAGDHGLTLYPQNRGYPKDAAAVSTRHGEFILSKKKAIMLEGRVSPDVNTDAAIIKQTQAALGKLAIDCAKELSKFGQAVPDPFVVPSWFGKFEDRVTPQR